MGNFIDITGQKFGRLTAIKKTRSDKCGHAIWLCKCVCGKEKEILGTHLVQGNINSCGCIRLENQKYIINKYKIDITTYLRLKRLLRKMYARCYNKNDKSFKNYGGRGIEICDEWLNKENGFEKFCEWSINNGYKEELSIDRIDFNGNYEPDNCRWATMLEQENNKRNNINITYKGETKTLKQWSKLFKIPYNTTYSRYSRGFELDKVFSFKDLRYKGEKNERNN